MFMSMICKLERVVEEIREAVKEVREHHGKRHRQYMSKGTGTALKLHFTTSRPPSRVPSRIFILDKGCPVYVGNDDSDSRFRLKLDNPHQE